VREAETAAQLCGILPQQPRKLRGFCGRLGAMLFQQWFLQNHQAFLLIKFVFVTVTRIAAS
jgi:uncharacterized protein YukE